MVKKQQPLDLREVSTDALEQELIRRTMAHDQAQWNKQQKQLDDVLTNMPRLLALLPEHDKLSCSDERPVNNQSGSGCRRCQLLNIQSCQYNDNVIVELTLKEIEASPLPEANRYSVTVKPT